MGNGARNATYLGFRLAGPLGDRLVELVGEVPVEVLSVVVAPPPVTLAVADSGDLEAVRVHGRHDVNPGRVHQLGNLEVGQDHKVRSITRWEIHLMNLRRLLFKEV